MKKKNTGARDIFLFLLIVAVLVALASFLMNGAPVEKTTYADVVRQFEAENEASQADDRWRRRHYYV